MMMKKLSDGLIIGAFFMCLSVVASYAEEAKKPITIAMFPCADVVMSLKKFHSLVTYLKQETGFDIEFIVKKDLAEFERAIKNKEIEFVFLDPHIYVKSADLYDKDTLISALTDKGSTSQSGVVIARKGEGINKLEDLKGKAVMFGPKLSAARWVAAKVLFEESGINIDKNLKAYSNGECCEDVAFNIYLKAVDAGVVCDHFLKEHSKRQQALGMDAKQIVAVCRTISVPMRVFAARQEVSDDIVTKVNQALIRLDKNKPAHAKILHRAELGGFQSSKDKDYDGIRMLIGVKTAE
ncbi:MAG: phosphate/phosphite/phosphonate ABC transporter substrate-binding protein [Deltaproteobacteria bacterium]|jgi:phosphonate transport system substrate-binding protein|nr:phosphate/phosphite/phosphonate ABC transporter substrate-binding protein [Deltaproteobacteria bacterium]